MSFDLILAFLALLPLLISGPAQVQAAAPFHG
jgi:hypothetical protein